MLQDNFLDRKQRLINILKKRERNKKPHRRPSLKWPPSQHSSKLSLVLLRNRALTHGNDLCKKAKLHTTNSELSPVMEGWETSQQSRSETRQSSNLTAVIHLTHRNFSPTDHLPHLTLLAARWHTSCDLL